jgi:hypothetical protein
MISLNVYLTAKDGEEAALETAIKDVWIAAMVKQPGFLRATLNTSFSDDELAALEANKPAYAYEMVSTWNTEQERLDWAALDIHQEVWPQVIEHCADVSYTLFNCDTTWNM